jgi:glycosyltransferase involved in cell wall biosynthesis
VRLLYLYPEEWTGKRAREIHTLSTCAALAEQGAEVTLVTAGGEEMIKKHCSEVWGRSTVPNLSFVCLFRQLGPVKSASIFSFAFQSWLMTQQKFDLAYIIHLKASVMCRIAKIRYAYEAHEIFGDGATRSARHKAELDKLEQETLKLAFRRIATSNALAEALHKRYELPDDFAVIPNAGLPPLPHSLANAKGPFIYFGGLADWKGLDILIRAGYAAQAPLRIVGGTRDEWQKMRVSFPGDYRQLEWEPRVPQEQMPQALAGARCGLIPTDPSFGAGLYSCPMKLFDYARCGLPVISMDLMSLQSLAVGAWCYRVKNLGGLEWMTALSSFVFRESDTTAALAWSAQHTWSQRAQKILALLRLSAQEVPARSK